MVTNTYAANTRSAWGVRLATLGLWALAGASVVAWGLRLTAGSSGPAAPVAAPAAVAPDVQALARLLGAGPAPAQAVAASPSLASRFVLQGVLAGTASGGGAALIAVDGKPPKPFRVGAAVDDGLVLQSLSRREARLGPAPTGDSTLTLVVPLKP